MDFKGVSWPIHGDFMVISWDFLGRASFFSFEVALKVAAFTGNNLFFSFKVAEFDGLWSVCTAQGGGGSFKDRKHIEEVGSCE